MSHPWCPIDGNILGLDSRDRDRSMCYVCAVCGLEYPYSDRRMPLADIGQVHLNALKNEYEDIVRRQGTNGHTVELPTHLANRKTALERIFSTRERILPAKERK